jgi:hypothetical protein
MVSAGCQGRRELQTTRVRIAFGPFPWVIDLWLPFMVYVSRIGFIAFYGHLNGCGLSFPH